MFLFSGIDLENIVYYKDSTHYFVMTAKKQSLLDKGVILNVCTCWLEFLTCLSPGWHGLATSADVGEDDCPARTHTRGEETACHLPCFWHCVTTQPHRYVSNMR